MTWRIILGAAPTGLERRPKCHFWRLPLELRFAIYTLAYGSGHTIKPRAILAHVELGPKGRAMALEKDRERNERQVCIIMALLLPAKTMNPQQRYSVVGRRLVNKQFLGEAMQHLAESNTFNLKWSDGCLELVSREFAQHLRSLVLSWNAYTCGDIDLTDICPKLRSLELRINAGTLFRNEWLDILSTAENFDMSETVEHLESTSIVKSLSLVRGIEQFALVYEEHFKRHCVGWTAAEERKAEAFRVPLEDILQKMVTRSKAPVTRKPLETRNARSRFPRMAKNGVKY